MKTAAIILSLAILLSCGVGIPGTHAATPDLSKIDIAAINSMKLRTDGMAFFMDVDLLLKNDGDKDIKLKDINFEVKFKGKDGVVNFGTAPVDELIIPGKAVGAPNPGTLTTTLQVKIGPKGEKTLERMVKLFNIVADPASPLIMLLEGAGEVGLKVEKGWIYQKGIKADLEFSPTIQREVLFK